MALLLLLTCAAVQWNDPDPGRWVLAYLVGSALCALWERGFRDWRAPAAWALACSAWAASLFPDAAGVQAEQLVQSMQASRPAIEFAREAGGLLVMAGWMAVLSRSAWKEGR